VCDAASTGRCIPIFRRDLLSAPSQSEMIRHLNLGTAFVKFYSMLTVGSKRSHSNLQSRLCTIHGTLTKAINKYAQIIVVHLILIALYTEGDFRQALLGNTCCSVCRCYLPRRLCNRKPMAEQM